MTAGDFTYTDYKNTKVPTKNYEVLYPKMQHKIVMVHFDNTGRDNKGNPVAGNKNALHIFGLSKYPDVDIRFNYAGTQRRFAQPELAAAVIAVLIEVKLNLLCGGFSFSYGTCFPSVSHNNGTAVDICYYPSIANFDLATNQNIIDKMIKYGLKNILIGTNSIYSGLKGSQGVDLIKNADHNNHLHCGKIKINK